MTHLCVKRFREEKPPLTAIDISKELETPIRLVNEVLFELVEAGVLSEVVGDEEMGLAYQPAIDIEDLTIQGVQNRVERKGIHAIPLAKSEVVETLSSCLIEFNDILASSPKNILLKNL
jgi:membrane protein